MKLEYLINSLRRNIKDKFIVGHGEDSFNYEICLIYILWENPKKETIIL